MTGPGPPLDEARAAVRDAVAAELAAWGDAGATHVAVSTMGHGLATVDDHLATLAALAEVTAARS